ncbi:MAG: murein hydrolase activator EnvC [Saprospiraceae bacterium]
MKYPAIILKLTKLDLRKSCFLALAFLFFLPLGYGQNRSTLETRRKKLLNNIAVTNSMLKRASKEKAVNLDQYLALKNQIKTRQALLTTLNEEVDLVTLLMERTENTVASLQSDILRLKEEYKAMLRMAFRQKMTSSTVMYLLSAESLNQAFSRWQYLKQYHKYRRKQAQLIEATQAQLSQKFAKLTTRKAEKMVLLNLTNSQADILQTELDNRNRILKKLRKNEKKLKKELRKHRYAHRKLNDAIETMIKNEMSAKRRTDRQPKLNARTAPLPATPNSKKMTANFRGNKGKLPWPVKKGVIIKRFGKQAHPTIPKILISNNGIDIMTDQNAKVHAVFAGSVVGTQFIPGQGNMLILKHGNYYTVYSNLETLYAKRGDWIDKDQRIATVQTNKTNKSTQVHFEIWRDKVRLNPADWITRR